MSDEPARADSLAGPALLAGLVMLVVHAAAAALMTAVAITASQGPSAPTGGWHVVVWVVAVVVAAGSLRPILRRARRPLAVGALAGLVAAAGYVLLSLALAAPGQSTPLLWARIGSLVAAAAAAGALTRPRQETEA